MSTTAIAAGLASAMMIIAFAAAADETAAPDTKPAHAENPWTPLFNGKDLAGWQVKCRPADKDKMFWFVRDGAIVCDSMKDGDHHYVWLMTKAEYGDFELRLKVRGHAPKSGMVAKSTSASGVGESVAGKDADAGDVKASSKQADAAGDDRSQHDAGKTTGNRSMGNSGVQIRSRYDDEAGWLDGPQVDVHPPAAWRTGLIYDETRGTRRWICPSLKSSAIKREQAPEKVIWHDDDWNDLTIRCEGTRILTRLNGLVMADFDGKGVLDDEDHRTHNVGLKGHIALQLHSGDKLLIEYKDIEIRPLKD